MEPMTIEISAVGETLRLTTKGSKGASTWTRNAAELTKPCVRLRGGPSFRLDVQTRFKLVDDVQAAIAKGGANAQILETAKTDPCSIFRPYEPSPITQAVGVWQKTDKGRWCGTVESTVVASFFRLPIGRTEITQFLCLEGDKLVGPDGEPNPPAAIGFMQACRERGVLVGKGGINANAVRISPPLAITREAAEEAADVFEEALAAVGTKEKVG